LYFKVYLIIVWLKRIDHINQPVNQSITALAALKPFLKLLIDLAGAGTSQVYASYAILTCSIACCLHFKPGNRIRVTSLLIDQSDGSLKNDGILGLHTSKIRTIYSNIFASRK
jgi:hypothetical protein